MSIATIILSFFFKGSKLQSRWRDSETGKFVKTPEMFRYTLGVSHIPYGRKYYSFTFIVWSLKDFDPKELTMEFVDLMESLIGYPYIEWWFKFKIGYQKIPVEPVRTLMETWEFYINDYLQKSGSFHFD